MEVIFKALGLGLLTSIWQMAILYGLYKLLGIFVISTSVFRFRLGLVLAFTGTIFFLLTIVSSLDQPFDPSHNFYNLPFSTNTNFHYWFTIISGIGYVLILIFASLKQFFGSLQSKRLSGILPAKIPVKWRLFIQQQVNILGIEKKVNVVASSLASPATYGWLKPVVLLPLSCLTGMDDKSLEALIVHELAHIKRNDYLWHIMLQIFETLLYPNPFMQLLVQDTKLESEKACDDLVLQFGYPAPLYARALLQIAKNQQSKFLIVFAKGSGHLLHRISRMLADNPSSKKQSKHITLAFLLACICFSIGTIQPLGENQNQVNGTIMPVLRFEPMESNGMIMSGLASDWKYQIKATRLSVFENRIGKRDEITVQQKSRLKNSNSKLLQQNIREDLAATPAAAEETSKNEEALFSNAVFINTSWANNIAPDITEKISPLLHTKTIFTSLLDKLDEKGELEDGEWETLVRIVSMYHQLGVLMQKEDVQAGNQLIRAEDIAFKQVLVIMYDENTGLLTANLIDSESVNSILETTMDVSNSDSQQVMLLHRKRDNRKTEIKL
jgi:beta-lactamase regulating signal transducer with metallopeptidase domain